jgi:hypothetical protein
VQKPLVALWRAPVSSTLIQAALEAAVHRADFERERERFDLERERCERFIAEVLKTTAELMAAPGSGGAARWRTRSLPSASVVAPTGWLSGTLPVAGADLRATPVNGSPYCSEHFPRAYVGRQ